MDKALEGRDFLFGSFTIADAALFYVCLWAGRVDITLPSNLAGFFARMKQRPAVQRTLAAEGLA